MTTTIKQWLGAGALALTTTLGATLPAQAADVGVSISVGQPGFYGQIDVGTMRPQLVYAQPVMVERAAVRPAPVYLRVPPGHQKNWAKHCREYGACGRPVYFVRDDWYQREYVPRYRDGYDRDHGRWRDDDDRHDHDDHGKGKGKGHGKGHGRD
ncbi:MAG: hypothetical protein ABW005_14370 [Burkholderiaceae bacterium]